METKNISLAYSFPDQSESFVHGFEVGRLDYLMQQGLTKVENFGFPIHEKNKDVIKRACEHHGYIPFFKPATYKDEHGLILVADGYINFHAVKMTAPN